LFFDFFPVHHHSDPKARPDHTFWDALFIVGANVVGPMGLDLIPVRGKPAAENLMKDYSGELILTLDQITSEIVDKARKGKFK